MFGFHVEHYKVCIYNQVPTKKTCYFVSNLTKQFACIPKTVSSNSTNHLRTFILSINTSHCSNTNPNIFNCGIPLLILQKLPNLATSDYPHNNHHSTFLPIPRKTSLKRRPPLPPPANQTEPPFTLLP